MKKVVVFFTIFFFYVVATAQSKKILFETNFGNFKVLLYDFTPNHQKMFLDALKNNVYKDVVFNRVIENFVVQGGMHDDEIAQQELNIPEDKKERFPAEFDARAIHTLGALGAGRDDNFEKASFLNQIYFVVGKKVSKADLDKYELEKGITYTKEQENLYLSIGGLPRLDGDYTVFGEVYEGLDVLLQISKAKTNKKDTPLKKIDFKITELKE